MDNIISNVNSIYTNGTYASGTGNSLEDKINNKDLSKEYEILRRKFYKAYDIDKIERLVKTSEEIEKLKNDNNLVKKLNEEIKKCRIVYEKNLDNYIENQILSETQEITNETTITEETEDEEEPEIRR